MMGTRRQPNPLPWGLSPSTEGYFLQDDQMTADEANHKAWVERIYTITFTYPNGEVVEKPNASIFFMRHPQQGLSRKQEGTGARPVSINISPKIPEEWMEYLHPHLVATLHPSHEGEVTYSDF